MKNRVYIFDPYYSKALLAFSETGDFINKTKLGRGPEEMTDPFALHVDMDKKNVVVWDQTLKTFFKYDLDLNLISKNKYEGVPLIDFAKVGQNEILVRSHYNQDFAYTLYDSTTKTAINQYIPDFKYEGVQALFRSISKERRTLLISSFDYHVYQFLDGDVHTLYNFDFGKYKISKENIEEHGLQGIIKLIRSGEKVSGLNELAESSNFLLFHVYHKDETIYYIYSFDKKMTYRLNDYFEMGILPKCEIRGTIRDDIFYAVVQPIDIVNFEEETGQKLVPEGVGLQQNPLILTFDIVELVK